MSKMIHDQPSAAVPASRDRRNFLIAGAVRAVRERKETQVGLIRFQYASGILFVMLPSGRKP